MATLKAQPYNGPTILSAVVGNNSDIFPSVLKLYHRGGPILDCTYGKGVFWKEVKTPVPVRQDILGHQGIDVQGDCRQLAFKSQTFTLVVLDPPYMHAGGNKSIKASISGQYFNTETAVSRSSTHAAIRDLYQAAAKEAHRVLKPKGLLVMKGMDEIESGRQCLFLADHAATPGFRVEDILVLVRKSRPAIRWPHQYHARKNHSYYLVLRKVG